MGGLFDDDARSVPYWRRSAARAGRGTGPEPACRLTPQEARIASPARDGRSDPEIATTLSISPRTVE
ncbi:MAG TPA: hypothetical protein VFH76_17305 [Kribbella sp.]|nr:hypothetical protein [Kribbella sp.]